MRWTFIVRCKFMYYDAIADYWTALEQLEEVKTGSRNAEIATWTGFLFFFLFPFSTISLSFSQALHALHVPSVCSKRRISCSAFVCGQRLGLVTGLLCSSKQSQPSLMSTTARSCLPTSSPTPTSTPCFLQKPFLLQCAKLGKICLMTFKVVHCWI